MLRRSHLGVGSHGGGCAAGGESERSRQHQKAKETTIELGIHSDLLSRVDVKPDIAEADIDKKPIGTKYPLHLHRKVRNAYIFRITGRDVHSPSKQLLLG